jgi:hypothetical protein
MTIELPKDQVLYHMYYDAAQSGSVARITTHAGSRIELFTADGDPGGEELGLLVTNIFEHIVNMAKMYNTSEQEIFDDWFNEIVEDFELDE